MIENFIKYLKEKGWEGFLQEYYTRLRKYDKYLPRYYCENNNIDFDEFTKELEDYLNRCPVHGVKLLDGEVKLGGGPIQTDEERKEKPFRKEFLKLGPIVDDNMPRTAKVLYCPECRK